MDQEFRFSRKSNSTVTCTVRITWTFRNQPISNCFPDYRLSVSDVRFQKGRGNENYLRVRHIYKNFFILLQLLKNFHMSRRRSFA